MENVKLGRRWILQAFRYSLLEKQKMYILYTFIVINFSLFSIIKTPLVRV